MENWVQHNILIVNQLIDKNGQLYTYLNFITKYGFLVNEKEFNKVIKAISSGIIVLTKFSDVNINDINLQNPQLFVNGLSFFDNRFNNSFIRNSFNVGSNPPCKSKLLKPHFISWHSIWMLPYKYLISNKVKEVLYKNVHRCYPVNATVSRYIHSVCDKCTFF